MYRPENNNLRYLLFMAVASFLFLQIHGLFMDTWQVKQTYLWAGITVGLVQRLQLNYGKQAIHGAFHFTLEDFCMPTIKFVSLCLRVLGAILIGLHLMAGVALSGQLPYDWPDDLYKLNAAIPESAQGYLVRTKEPLADVNLAGPDLSKNDSLSSFGAKGQKVPYSLVVYASTAIRQMKVICSDLKSEKGEKITADHIRIRTGMRQIQYRGVGSPPKELGGDDTVPS